MFVLNSMQNSSVLEPIVDHAWYGGARTGLQYSIAKQRCVDWEWSFFFDEVIAIITQYNIDALDLSSPSDRFSLLDVFGGFISVAGRMTEQGLKFPADEDAERILNELVPQVSLERDGTDLVVSAESLQSFMHLVRIRGPLEDESR